ncbi:diguanylate cyclase/phosphodiesterase with PAS/PAC sensor(s) [Shewanella halifaxensis HAW-EB4]|uniref:cyclic-guanylate-specific phosphodiesterase n=1 Tax=Shewanella halifaxensis (strain HAW-EB4) TaxID=458817 RepID=B0TR82_SHEHH|nr:EAL domain-containing protein [Shewanella halifaxensis]ABZ75054.1 diguanylate cyclase/phosphodiesterase with PAS/PAC sensor(s) [Shewanella halifaxensis HAW-EB4]
MRITIKKIWLSLLLLVITYAVPALASGAVQRVFTANDGLNNATVWDISFDKHGFTWLATEEGLYRVSSNKVRRIDKLGLNSRLGDSALYLAEPLGLHHILVSGAYQIYLYDIHRNEFIEFGSSKLFPEYRGGGIVSQVEESGGDRIFLTYDGELLRFNYQNMTLQRINFLPSNPDHPWRIMLPLSENRLLVGKESHLEVRDINGVRLEVLPWSDAWGEIKNVFKHSSGRAWITTSKGLFEIDQKTLSITRVEQLEHYITNIAEDKHGYLWLSTRAGLLRWFPDAEKGTLYGNELKLKSNIDYTYDIAVDDTGLIWVGGSGDGVAILTVEPNFLKDKYTKTAPYKIKDEVIWTIYAEDNHVWFGTDAGLILVDNLTQKSYLINPHGISLNDSIYKIDSLNKDFLLLSTTNGLSVVNKSTFHSQSFASWSGGQSSLEYKVVYNTYFDPFIEGRIWFATSSGLYYWEQGFKEPKPVRIGSALNSHVLVEITAVTRDSSNRLWLGGNRIFGYLDAQLTFHPKMEPLSTQGVESSVRFIKEVGPDELWLGLKSHGLLSFNMHTGELKNLTDSWNVTCQGVYFIEEVSHYRLIGCPQSLIRQNMINGELITISSLDGLISDELNEGAYFSSEEGFFLGTPDGAMLIDIDLLKNRVTNESVLLESIEIYFEDRTELSLLPESDYHILPGAQLVSFQLARRNYLDAKPMRLKYRLRQGASDDEASYIFLEGKSHLNISGLGSGSYVLDIISLDNNIWSETPFSFHFYVEQYWWQTSWFKSVLLLILLLVGLGGALIRQRQVKAFREINLALTDSENRLKQALKGSNSERWEWQLGSNLFCLENIAGLFSDGEPQVYLKLEQFPIHRDDASEVMAAWQDMLLERTDRFEVEYRYCRADNTWGWVRVMGRPVERNHLTGVIERVAGIYSDISEQRKLKDDVYLLAQAFENTSEAVLIFDSAERVQVTNKAAKNMMGLDSKRLIGLQFSQVLQGGEKNSSIVNLLDQGLSWAGECFINAEDSLRCAVWLNVSSILNTNGDTTHYVVVFSDITERKRTEADLRRLANYDVLTGLPNRSLFSSKLSQSVYQAERDGGNLALLFLDLDRFKHVNDSYGHSMGDALLVEASNRLQALISDEHVLCRFGGDEFVILLRNNPDIDVINHLCDALLASIELPFELYGREFYISTSIGVSLWPEDAKQPESLIKNADLAMYHAKEEGKGNFKYYSEERNAEALYHLRLEAELRKAIERNELELHFQPQIDILQNDKLVGVEALLRWNHPKEGLVRTDIFIKVAEACGLIVEIDRWVMREACIYGARWAALLPEPLKVSVNISALHFRQPDFIKGVQQVFAETSMPNTALSFEITEGVLMKELKVAKQHIQELKSLGVNVAIDDFGTGYSSLAYLRHFEVNTLKIDRSFLIDIATNKADQAIASSIIELARNLKLDVVAEGVETHEQLEQVFSRGCYVIQGYYFAKPMPAAEIESYMGLNQALSLEV